MKGRKQHFDMKHGHERRFFGACEERAARVVSDLVRKNWAVAFSDPFRGAEDSRRRHGR